MTNQHKHMGIHPDSRFWPKSSEEGVGDTQACTKTTKTNSELHLAAQNFRLNSVIF